VSDFELALVHYRLLFPAVASLGVAPACEVWKQEYDRIAASGLRATLIVGTTSDAGGATAQRQFDQKVLLRALIIRRAELDETFEAAVLAPPSHKMRRRAGTIVQLG
jgi:hypothetical protein